VTKTGILLTTDLLLAFGLIGGARADPGSHFSGIASFYSDDYSGRTATGDQYDPTQFTAAHPTLPFGTLLQVSDACNDRSVTVVVNDRGPFVGGRVLDLSKAAAEALGLLDSGTVLVTAVVERVRPIQLRTLLSDEASTR